MSGCNCVSDTWITNFGEQSVVFFFQMEKKEEGKSIIFLQNLKGRLV